jgi:hypothetical protein
LIAHPDWTIENVWHFTAENARLYGRGSPWFRTACVLHELEDILKPRLDALRNADSVTGFVFEVLGIRYGTDPKEHHVLNAHGSIPPDRIKRAIQHRHPIPPKEMLGLVQTALKEVPLPKLRGSESGPREDTQKKIRMAAALLKVHGETINWSEQISRFGCSEQEMYTFRSRYRAKIRFAAETMTLDEAAALWGANQ